MTRTARDVAAMALAALLLLAGAAVDAFDLIATLPGYSDLLILVILFTTAGASVGLVGDASRSKAVDAGLLAALQASLFVVITVYALGPELTLTEWLADPFTIGLAMCPQLGLVCARAARKRTRNVKPA